MKARVKKCSQLMRNCGCDSLLVSDPLNIAYLTGSQEAKGYLLISTQGKPTFFTNFIYQAAAKKLKDCDIIVVKQAESTFKLVAKTAARLKAKRFGFEAQNLSAKQYQSLKTLLADKRVDCLTTDGLIESLRAVKEPGELKLIKKSIQISEEAFQFVREIFDGSMSEKGLKIELERFLRLKGDDDIAFSSIVASGKNTAFPHHYSNETIIGNKFFLIDLGSKHYGYCADLTRVFFCGKMPLLFRRIYDTVRKSQAQAIAKIKAGVRVCDVDKAARKIIDKKGWGKYFGHSLGHGVGMAVHELPRINPKNTAVLKEGMVITVEPGIYLTNRFGIRLEDMVLVKKNKSEVLSGHGDW